MTGRPRRSRIAHEEVRRNLEAQIEDLQAALHAITQGGVDAVVVQHGSTADVYTLATADKPYRVILEDMGDGAVTVSSRGVILYANRAFCELVGATRSAVLGQDLTSFVTPDDAAELESCLGVGVGRTMHSELGITAGDAGARTLHVAASGLEQDGEEMTSLILTDVTERHRTAVLLAEAADRFSAAFDEAPVGMALVDVDGQILRSNEALSEMLASPDTVVGEPIFSFVHTSDRSLVRWGLGDLFARRQKSLRREVRMLTDTGVDLWVHLSASLVLARSGDHAVVHIEDVSERKLYESRLQQLADRDPLTGLYNRRRFQEDLGTWLAAIDRHGGCGAVMLIDLDNFKYVNDTLGHQSGDRLLKSVGSALLERTRRSDLVGRLGGDEFAVALTGVGRDQAVPAAHSYLETIKAAAVDINGTRVRASGTIGVVLVDHTTSSTADEVLGDADVAMYEGKEEGRDSIVVFDPSSVRVRKWRTRLHTLDIVREGLEDDLFMLYAQPILDLARDEVNGHELLLRLRQRGQVLPPGEFLDVAERHGLAPAIDRVVVRKALRAIAETAVPPGTRWEINLSASSLSDGVLLEEIEHGIVTSGITPEDVVFEITETAAISNMVAAQRFVERIRRLGCRFALDDFGAGYGSFYNLKHLPFDFLKIDGEFVRELTTQNGDAAIVRAIVSAAKGLGKQTIAEYVTDAPTLEVLRSLGVDFAQGFHVGRPAPLDQLGLATNGVR